MSDHCVSSGNGTPIPRLQRLAYLYRGHLVCVPLIVAIFCTWHEYDHHAPAWVAAGIVFGVGLWIRIWAQQHLRFRITRNMVLTRTGPYGLMRNPIYVGNTLICLGLVVASQLLWLVPVALLVCMGVYTAVVRHEERKLTRVYGEPYAEYLNEVPRWFPKRPDGYRPEWINDQWKPSLRAEAYNLLLLVPFILKELFM
jgi:protein-S-isoprenylcysteine O-methyltransferase Ste14